MRARKTIVGRAGLVVAALLLALPATGAADDPNVLRTRGAELAAAEQAATLGLFSIESRLTRARAELDAVQARIASLDRERASSQRQLVAARRTLAAAEDALAAQVRLLYLNDEPDPLAVFLGAASIEEAIESLDSLRRAASVTSSVLEESRVARARIARLLRVIGERRRVLAGLRDTAAARAAQLSAERARRAAYIEGLRAEQKLNEQQIAQALADAQAAQTAATAETAKAEATESIGSLGAQTLVTLTPEPPPPPPQPQPSPQAPVARSGRTLTVVATAYTLRGTTATGIPTGPGVVAVDPTVIPLGTRMTIPGYGEAVAADTGSAIKGLRIDVWVRTAREAAAWQWRTVTITLH